MTYLPQRNRKEEKWHVPMTINDHSIQASSSLRKQRNLTLSQRLVQKCEMNQILGGQRRSLKQHRSKRLKNGRGYYRLCSVLPAQERLCWHFCSCWVHQEGKGDLGGHWSARATWSNLSSKHEVTGERFMQVQTAVPSRYRWPWLRHGNLRSDYFWIKMPQP